MSTKPLAVRRKSYEKIMERARKEGKTAVELVEEMLEFYERYEILRRIKQQPVLLWPKFPALHPQDPYHVVLMDPRIKEYKSTSWVRSREYADKAGAPQLRPVGRVFTGDFEIEKVLILSPKSWRDKKAWEFVWKWINLSMSLKPKLQVFVVREESIRDKIEEKYFDMGIYGNIRVGFLTLTEDSEPTSYYWVDSEQELEAAKRNFEEIKKHAVKQEDYMPLN
jgi:hypothetical protein